MKYLALIFIVLNLKLSSFGQYDFKKKKIQLETVDTTESFIYETENAKLYFSQNDLIEYFNNLETISKSIYNDFIDTLITNNNEILIKSDTIYDAVYERSIGNGVIERGKFPSGKDKRDYLSRTFMFVASDLMIQGKVIPYIKKKKEFYPEYIIAKKKDGLYGTEFMVFLSSDRSQIYQIVTALGE